MDIEKTFFEIVKLKEEAITHAEKSDNYYQKANEFKKDNFSLFAVLMSTVTTILCAILSFLVTNLPYIILYLVLFVLSSFLIITSLRIYLFNKKNKTKYNKFMDKSRNHSFELDDVNDQIAERIRASDLSDFLSRQDISFFNNCSDAERYVIEDYKYEIENNENLKNYHMFNQKNKSKKFNINNI